jgi:hypothetical protein
MPGLDPGIHQKKRLFAKKWIAGSNPAMTTDRLRSRAADKDASGERGRL